MRRPAFGPDQLARLDVLLGELVGSAREEGRAGAAVNPVDPKHPTLEQATRLAGARAAADEARRAVLRYVAGTHGGELEDGRLVPRGKQQQRR